MHLHRKRISYPPLTKYILERALLDRFLNPGNWVHRDASVLGIPRNAYYEDKVLRLAEQVCVLRMLHCLPGFCMA